MVQFLDGGNMAHIKLPDGYPGITGPMKAFPNTAKPLNLLAETLLQNESKTFSMAERETVAAYVSYLNECQFCSESHAAVADFHWDKPVSKKVWESLDNSPNVRLTALLKIAAKVQKSGRLVTKADVEAATNAGATEADVHDTVLIAAAFCLYNRYVDGLATFAPPRNDPGYKEIGKRLATTGYLNAID
jgi:alkylhydroperoxidase family enzyme